MAQLLRAKEEMIKKRKTGLIKHFTPYAPNQHQKNHSSYVMKRIKIWSQQIGNLGEWLKTSHTAVNTKQNKCQLLKQAISEGLVIQKYFKVQSLTWATK